MPSRACLGCHRLHTTMPESWYRLGHVLAVAGRMPSMSTIEIATTRITLSTTLNASVESAISPNTEPRGYAFCAMRRIDVVDIAACIIGDSKRGAIHSYASVLIPQKIGRA